MSADGTPPPDDAPKKKPSGAAFARMRREREAEEQAASLGPITIPPPGDPSTLHMWLAELIKIEVKRLYETPGMSDDKRRREFNTLVKNAGLLQMKASAAEKAKRAYEAALRLQDKFRKAMNELEHEHHRTKELNNDLELKLKGGKP